MIWVFGGEFLWLSGDERSSERVGEWLENRFRGAVIHCKGCVYRPEHDMTAPLDTFGVGGALERGGRAGLGFQVSSAPAISLQSGIVLAVLCGET